ncbi:trimethylamine--corrinoid methyltransferase [Mesorhizobium tamadayense]|uniref:Trimethylamine--corrinoid methyltransferase n=1 Tax=Mesorhizobium tamadayense TaxID=425306 RepID=A0A3P3EQI3_9HYPH|nr:trimethylamine methyltransferase family protein [Mesorhizobium tamadayense]RRH88286.1 trimethylamine--corrinoid methyltransferase [Mesorhizobium tamadayense]
MKNRSVHKERELSDYFARPYLPATDPVAFDDIEKAADRVLEETGIRFQDDPETIDQLRQIGAIVDGDIVRLEGAVLRRIIRENAPSSFRLRARNPDRDTIIGGSGPAVFAPIYGAPDVLLESGERVKGGRDIYRRLVSIAHESAGLTNTGHMVCVMDDVSEPGRPLEMLLAHLTCSDKPFMGSIASPEIATEYIDLTAAALRRPPQTGACNLLHLVNCTPPLTYWENPLKCLRSIALAGEATMISSYMMMGATSPATIAGSLVQGYAEVLAGLALTQLWQPGAPVVMGILGWPFDMRSMQPNFGDPASQLVQLYSSELARRLGIPSRGDGAVTSAKVDDAQAGGEGARVLAASVASGAGFILHSAGWLEQGRCVSVGKFHRDATAIAETYLRTSVESEPPSALDVAIEAEIRERLLKIPKIA